MVIQCLLCVALLLLSGCAQHIDPTVVDEVAPAGFLKGFWHGLILFFAWVASWFSESVAIYATHNNGGWYDFGFILGLSCWGGSTSRTCSKCKQTPEDWD